MSTIAWKPKNLIFLKNAYLSVSFVMLCKQFLTVQIDWCYHAINKQSSRFQHLSVLTTCTFMFRQVCIIEPSFFKTTSGMYRRPFKGQHLVMTYLYMYIYYMYTSYIHYIKFTYIVYLKMYLSTF